MRYGIDLDTDFFVLSTAEYALERLLAGLIELDGSGEACKTFGQALL